MRLRLTLLPTILSIALCAQDVVISGKELLTRGLRGNKIYSISVALSGPGKALGLSAAQVEDQVRVRLRQAGIAIDPETDGGVHPPRLHVQLEIVGPTPDGWYAVFVRTLVNDNLVRASPCLTPQPCECFFGISWQESHAFLGRGETNIRQEVRLRVDQLLDRFVSDQLEMNGVASR